MVAIEIDHNDLPRDSNRGNRELPRRRMRLSIMGSVKTEKLRGEYRNAFDRWALNVSQSQVVDGSEAEQSLHHSSDASEVAYRESRDRLTESMIIDAAESASEDGQSPDVSALARD